MQKKKITLFLALLMATLSGFATTNFYKIDIQDEINSTAWRYVQQGLEKAKNKHPKAIVFHINTYGGELLFADSIRTAILNCGFPTIAYIDNNAASAGALISIACDSIFMQKGASIGAATVVDQTGDQAPDKYQSYMRSIVRATAETKGKDSVGNYRRNPIIAEAMVDNRTTIEGVIDSTKTLTLTTTEAIKLNYCEGSFETVDELFLHLNDNSADYTVDVYEPTFYDALMGFLTSSMLRALLIMIIIGGIYFELQTPGVGFPLAAAVAAALLYFAPLYIDGLATNWEILIFVVGLILVALELFVIPGFGIFGITGIVFVVGGLTLSLLGNDDFSFSSVDSNSLIKALATVLLSLVASTVLIYYLSDKIGKKGMFEKVALQATMKENDGYIGVPTEQRNLIGKSGVSATDLRPSGKVLIEGKRYDAVAVTGFIEEGKTIVVEKYETGQIYVVEKQD